jgi:hypothetical protein
MSFKSVSSVSYACWGAETNFLKQLKKFFTSTDVVNSNIPQKWILHGKLACITDAIRIFGPLPQTWNDKWEYKAEYLKEDGSFLPGKEYPEEFHSLQNWIVNMRKCSTILRLIKVKCPTRNSLPLKHFWKEC